MNCKDIEELAPLYLSGEMDEEQGALFRSHLAQCRNCAAEIDRQIALDEQLRSAVSMELPDAAAIQGSVRRRIAAERWRIAVAAAVAAAVILGAIFGYRALRPEPVSPLYADAALDHRMEVMEHQPRHWRSDAADIERLAGRFQLRDVRALAPEGYRLEHAKMCGIGGKPALHLVYTNGSREFSLFIRARAGNSIFRPASVGSEHVTAFQKDGVEGIVATAGSSRECVELARFASSVL